MPIRGQMTATARATTAMRMMLAGIPYKKNSPVENCFDS
jgi:hypothetical protein